MEFLEYEQPLLVGGINHSTSKFEKIDFVVEEFVEGIISYSTIDIAKEFLREIKSYVSMEVYEANRGEHKALFYVVLDNEKMELYIYAEGFIRNMYEFKEYESKLIESVLRDIS